MRLRRRPLLLAKARLPQSPGQNASSRTWSSQNLYGFKHVIPFNECCLLAFSLRMGFRGIKMALKSLRSPKRGPEEVQDGPKSARERPKSAQRGLQEPIGRAPTRGPCCGTPPFLIDVLQYCPKGPPRGPKAGPKKALQAPKIAPKWHQDRSNRLQRGFQNDISAKAFLVDSCLHRRRRRPQRPPRPPLLPHPPPPPLFASRPGAQRPSEP